MKVVVIGSGLVGLLTARVLCSAGLEVVILEQGERSSESSWAGAGILSPLYPWRYDDRINILAQWGKARYGELSKQLFQHAGIDPQWRQSGLLISNLAESEVEKALQWAETFSEEVVRCDEAEISRIQHDLNLGNGFTLYLPNVAQIRNPRLLKALHQSLTTQGVTLKGHSKVKRIIEKKAKAVGVELVTGEIITANAVVLCGGAWSSILLSELDIEIEQQPVKGQMVLYKAEPGLLKPILLKDEKYMVPRGDGRILVGSTMEYTGFDKSNSIEGVSEISAFANEAFPKISRYPVEKVWAGLRPSSPNGVPWIMETPQISGLYINSGHYRNGVVMGLASAHLVTDLILGRSSTINPEYYKHF